ncbi:hypothetical protein [Streptomyces sp. NPDC001851]|uniref:hypothetical protein n=1 Tax=Streptomyces sp. NPDC001851 TaxID=3154529 RepID=UPI00332197B6
MVHDTDLHGFTVTRWRLPATHPPFAALLSAPATWLPVPALKTAFPAGDALLPEALAALSARLAGRRLSASPLCTTTALLLGSALIAAAALRAAQPVLPSARISSASMIR